MLMSSLLVSCTGAGATTSWPSLTVDQENEIIYLASGPHIYAVDASTGVEKWRFPQKPSNNISFYAAPALTEDGHLIVAGYDNVLYGLNPEEFEPSNLTFLDVRAESVDQAVADGLAMLELSESEVDVQVLIQGNPGILGFGASPSCVRLILKDAEGSQAAAQADTTPCDPTEWTFSGASNRYVASPLAVKSQVFAPNSDTTLYVLNQSGTLRWQFQAEHALWSQPSINGELVYLPSMDHHVYAIDIESGDLAWRSEDMGGAIGGDPTLSPDGVLYIGTLGSGVVALNTQDGSVLWRFDAEGWVWSGPALKDGKLYFGDLSGTLFALNAADGSPLWTVQPDAANLSGIVDKPLLVEDAIYLVTQGGTVHALNLENGITKWTRLIDKASLYGSPVLAGNNLIVAPVGADAALYAYDLNGNPVWQFSP